MTFVIHRRNRRYARSRVQGDIRCPNIQKQAAAPYKGTERLLAVCSNLWARSQERQSLLARWSRAKQIHVPPGPQPHVS